MVLCAGLGTRLQPITQKIPKPLVEVLNIPNVLYVFYLLKQAGIKEVLINVFHLSQKMERFFTERAPFGFQVGFSKENPLMGTGGGLKKAESFFHQESFVLANCDFVTDFSLTRVIAQHQQSQALATMVLIQDAKREPLYSKVGIDEKGVLCVLRETKLKTPTETGIFTGVHVLAPAIFDLLEEKPCGITETLYPRLMKEQPGSARAVIEKQGF
jgi:mannose-1-phosphate guanylyltransferase